MDINTLSLASAVAAHAAARQQVIAENVAHADTPGYRARDIADFASIVDDTIGALGAETPNANTVSLEDQMLRAAEVRQEHEMAIGVYSKSLEILRASVTRR